ncbi:DUF2637 domain-containing protein [Streptomyces sp. NBC_01571]|uniref:DUF2637 domain-containing protein n=1 Tax=Streptomyces sp. NBC_01571 TaxID=2975883 RepID=UPI002253D0A0|nr:DUF2637 domain-containing protein [Streptomyces sp. NBC_01571]MCX4581066.1 DUF2637 domain-containing protein [Streptomyces sp. NBC_01571]
MAAGNDAIPQLTRAHRILIGVVVAGALVIAGIGFAGSYAAVRELALKKGFGNFAYVFPIGIDAGICVLLALDLLLTWIRIPFPLLRQTAWLLTVATIAFNGAAAWPDPLGVGMHAVIPVLFVVSVEAARHAIGRIADITADKHMEGVRLTRWMLSPLPTFLLWRRMKLWELRSYEQVIKLEQERLVYQARLRSRFGRAWRRKAPVESLMPLRLARYGVPLAETAPSGLAAAGIEEPAQITVEQVPAATPAERSALDTAAVPEPGTAAQPASASESAGAEAVTIPRPRSEAPSEEAAERFAVAYQAFLAQFQAEPTTAQWALWLRDRYGISTGTGEPLSEEQLQPLLQVLRVRYTDAGPEATVEEPEPADQSWDDYFRSAWYSYQKHHGVYPDADALAAYLYERDAITGDGGRPIAGADLAGFVASFEQRELDGPELPPEDAASTAVANGSELDPADTSSSDQKGGRDEAPSTVAAAEGTNRGPRAQATLDQAPEAELAGEKGGLTTVDRYYLAWAGFLAEHGQEPKDRQLSAVLAERHGVLGRGGQGVSPSTLRRYMPGFRVYAAWSALRETTATPTAQDVARECATREISVRRTPVTPEMIEPDLSDFERRWHALAQHERQEAAAN